jgi:hypothetical protein
MPRCPAATVKERPNPSISIARRTLLDNPNEYAQVCCEVNCILKFPVKLSLRMCNRPRKRPLVEVVCKLERRFILQLVTAFIG